MEEIKPDLNILKDYLFRDFAIRYYHPTITEEGDNTTFSFSIPTKWRDVISEVIEIVKNDTKPIIMLHKCSFDIVSEFFSEKFPDIFVTSSQYWDMVNKLTDKIDELVSRGYSNIEPEFTEETAKFILGSEFEIAAEFEKDKGNFVALYYLPNRFGYKRFKENLISNLEINSENCIESIGFTTWGSELIYGGSGRLVMINNAINAIHIPNETLYKPTNTYFAIDDSGLIKIGRSNDWEKREKQLKTGNANIKIILVLQEDVEVELHKKFYDYQYSGEWYRISKDDINKIINNYTVEFMEENIEYYLDKLAKK